VQSFLITQRHEFQEKKAEAELKKEEHPKTPSYHITPDKDSSTGFSYTNFKRWKEGWRSSGTCKRKPGRENRFYDIQGWPT